MSDTVSFYDLADELNVRVVLLVQLAQAGKLATKGNRITKDSADELRWTLAIHRHVVAETSQE